MSHKHFARRDALGFYEHTPPPDPETQRKAAVTVIENVPEQDREMILQMLGIA